jgi:acetyl esterase/lipase
VVLWSLGGIVLFSAAAFVAFRVSPWPSALLLRQLMNWGGERVTEALAKHVPPGISAEFDLRYASDRDALLDVFYPATIASTNRTLPTIVWVHGGGFLAGDKDQIANYLKILAARGYTTVGVNYSLAPRAIYPTPIREVTVALGYLRDHAAALHIDASRLFLAGDSAGAQIAAEVALIVSDPALGVPLGIKPTISPPSLRGLILYCGIYDPRLLDFTDGRFGSFLRAARWSYFGTKQPRDNRSDDAFDIIDHVTAAMPPIFVSAGNADPLEPQSRALADAAAKAGVPVDRLFFPPDYAPPLPHEYQFNLDNAAGQRALDQSTAFLADRLATSP